MRKVALALLAVAGIAALFVAVATRGSAPSAAQASSHREAPLIAEDPSADNTDVFAFRSPDKPDTATIISNWIPAEDPGAGPMYYEFSSTARYNINIDTDGDGKPNVVYRFQFQKSAPVAFLRNTVQRYTVSRILTGRAQAVFSGTTPPNNIGPRTTPNYHQLALNAVGSLSSGGSVFAGQRDDAFYADIGAIFDSLNFRRGTGITGGGKDFFAGYGVHSIALQLPIAGLGARNNIIGVWSSTDRLKLTVANVKSKVRVKVRVRGKLVTRTKRVTRRVVKNQYVQVSRLGNPLVNELLIPTERKDEWNRGMPLDDGKKFLGFFQTSILAALINRLYPGVINAPESGRDDLVGVFLTGLPGLNNTGPTMAEEIRLNLAIAPAGPVGTGNRLGVLGKDLAGYPNGRRLEDDVIDISERAVAGILKNNARANLLGDGVDGTDIPYMQTFPYQADPFSGFDNTKGQQKP